MKFPLTPPQNIVDIQNAFCTICGVNSIAVADYILLLEQVFTKEELEGIAELCKKHDVVVFSDDVYEWLVYAPNTTCKIGGLMYVIGKQWHIIRQGLPVVSLWQLFTII